MLTDEMVKAGWIAHFGGPCPMPLDSKPAVMLADGSTFTDEAKYFDWRNDAGATSARIIAYRPEKQDG